MLQQMMQRRAHPENLCIQVLSVPMSNSHASISRNIWAGIGDWREDIDDDAGAIRRVLLADPATLQ